MPLEQKQPDQHDERNRNHVWLERRGCDLQTLDCRQYRDRRGDHAVAVEQRRTENSESHQQPACPRLAGGGALHQCHERHDAALALVVSAHDEHHVLHRHHDDERPEDQRQHAEHVGRRHLHGVRAMECLFHGVQGAGADVTVHDADGGDGECREVLAGWIGGLAHAADARRTGRPPPCPAWQAFRAVVPAGEQLWSESMENAGLAALEISKLGIVLKVPRATTGPDALIMDEYRLIGQAGTMKIVRIQRRLPAG
ncbi:MAG: hypothetical protein H6R47_993 [Proteobacteria bacterium]|nr:hypothetical protein [Pseudomonadota bacterium]